jgi:hypothetical protein
MGLIDVYRINPADQFSVFSPSLKKTQEITYYTLLAKIRGDLNITSTSGNVDNWNQAYDQTIMSGVVTGYTTKTITLTRRDGTEISFDFQDLSPASEDTLDMVTTRGNNTVNIINVGGVSTPWLDLDTSYTGTTEVGRFSWNLDNATSDLGLNDNVVLKIGQDDMWYVRNESGSAIPRGTAVMAVGTVGASGRILVSPMVANGSVAAKHLLGITSEEIADDADGYVLAKGNLREFNTSAYTAGQVLWCSPTTPGALTATEPAAPNLKLPIAFVVHANAVGMLAVRVTAGSTLSENNQVQFGTLANNDVLTYVSANGRWQNVPISTIASTLAFSTIAVTGQSSIVAETNQDTLNIAAGTAISLTTNASTDTLTITNTAPDQIVSLTGTGTTTITGTYPNFTINSDDQYDGTVTSVALTAPSAFTVTGSPITTSGTIALGGAGTAAQYIRGDGQLGDFPTTSGGGSSVSYYLNGSINQGTFGGNVYREFSKTPIVGAGTDFSIAADGYIAQFITDVNDPSLLEIPGGNWNVEFWFSASSSGGTPSFYVELSKYDGTTFTAIANNSATPEFIAFGTTISQYYTALAVPQTTLAVTDRLALRVYVIHSGRTITLHTEDNHLCQVITTFSTGLNALNGLTKQVQYFATGTSGTDFNISSVTDTHTFNLPTASSLNRGALSSADWITFNGKADFSFKTIAVAGQSSIVADAADDTLTVASGTGITLTTNSSTDTLTITNSAPDQTVVLTAGTGITTSGTYPSFTITNNDRGSSQNIFKNLAVSGQSTIVADNNDDTITVASGTGISLTTNSVSDTLTITNTAPDQVVSIAAGTGMSVSGTYPSFTVTNTAPDQVVSITGAGTSVVTGTYPNFTITSNDQYVGTVTSVNLTAGTGITVSGGPIISSGSITVNNNDRGSSQNIFKNIAVPGQTTIVASTNNDTFTVKPGSGISATTLGNDITLSNTDPGSAQNIFKNIAVAGQNTIVADGNNDVLNFVSGTGISLTTNDTTDSLTVTNSAPDQVVALSSGTGISVSGTYPNFTITNTSPSSGGTVTGTGTTNYVTKWTSVSAVGNSQIFDNGTNVGIGTATPGAKLDVVGNTYIRSGILYVDTIASYATTNVSLASATNLIIPSGNVGIGTTSPNLNATGSVLHINTSANNASAIHFTNATTGTTATDGLIIGRFGDNINYLYTYENEALHFGTNNGVRMVISAAGSVGIGNTSPGAPLDVTGIARATSLSTVSGLGLNVAGYAYLSQSLSGVMTFLGHNVRASDSVANTAIVQNGSWISSLIKLYYNEGITFHTDSTVYAAGATYPLSTTERMRITPAGNVGIGTTSPTAPLVFGKAVYGATTSEDFFRIKIQDLGGIQNDVGIGQPATECLGFNVSGAGYISFNEGTNGERVRIANGGNVGIGTTTPGAKLDVVGNTYIRGGNLYVNTIASYSSTNVSLQSSTNFIVPSGNIGIGTTSPTAKLDVSAGTNLNLGVQQLVLDNFTNDGVGITFSRTSSDSDLMALGVADTDKLGLFSRSGIIFATGGAALYSAVSESMRITTAGDVGIGTSSPSAKLHVIGNATVSSTLATVNAKITGTLTDRLNLPGTAGQVLSSTATGIEWVAAGGGGGGSTIIVKDEGVSIGSSFTTLNFIGNNIEATASGSTASITAFNNAGTGSIFIEAVTTNYAPGATFGDVEIDSGIIFVSSPDAASGSSKLIATVTFGVENVSAFDGFNSFEFRLYDVSQSIVVSKTTHTWAGYMSKNEGLTRTVFTFHIPLDTDVAPGDEIRVQAKQGVSDTPEIYYCAITLLEGTT